MINMHYVRHIDDVFDTLQQSDFVKRVFLARPAVVLNINNEYLTQKISEELQQYYRGVVERPARHFYGRFVKDMKQWNLQHIDFMHYTIPIFTPMLDGFRFPSSYIGQYGVYEALRHLLLHDRENAHNVGQSSI